MFPRSPISRIGGTVAHFEGYFQWPLKLLRQTSPELARQGNHVLFRRAFRSLIASARTTGRSPLCLTANPRTKCPHRCRDLSAQDCSEHTHRQTQRLNEYSHLKNSFVARALYETQHPVHASQEVRNLNTHVK